MKVSTKVILALVMVFLTRSGHPWEVMDRVVAVVNERPIVESDLMGRLERIQQFRRIPRERMAFEKSRILDKFIEESFILQAAEEQSILVTDEKVNNHLKKVMARMNIATMEDLKKKVETAEKMNFEDYREEVRKSLITEQVMSMAIGVTPPTIREARDWYNKNRDKLGFQVNVKNILLRPKNNSLAEEKRVNQEINGLRNQIMAGASFEDLARKFSGDPESAKKGGDLGWVTLAELDPYFATQVYQLNRPGQLSGVIKSSYGYHLVKYLGRRPVTYDAVEDKIMNLLFQQKIAEQFKRWVVEKRREADIKIFMDDYKKA